MEAASRQDTTGLDQTSQQRIMRRRIGWALTAAAFGALFTTTAAATDNSFCGNRADFPKTPRLTVIGLTSDQRLVRFRECNPARSKDIGTVYGLSGDDTALIGIDFRV